MIEKLDELFKKIGYPSWYRLDENNQAHPCTPTEGGSFKFDQETRKRCVVAQESYKGLVYVSTVFLGLDHQIGEGEPLLFESLVSGETEKTKEVYGDGTIIRYSTWEQAEAGHKIIMAELKRLIDEEA